MVKSDLLAVADGGLNITSAKKYQMECGEEKKYATVEFVNQSIRYNISIRVGGANLIIAPGASLSFSAPQGTYLVSQYDCVFIALGGAGTITPNLVILTQHYL